MVFSKKLLELLDWLNEINECGDLDYMMAIKCHVMCIADFMREDGKHIRKHQAIGILPGCYDYYLTLGDRLVYKDKAIKSTIRLYTAGEMVESGEW